MEIQYYVTTVTVFVFVFPKYSFLILIFNLQIASVGVRLAVGVPGLQEIGGVGLAGSEVRGLGLSHRAIAIGVGVRW